MPPSNLSVAHTGLKGVATDAHGVATNLPWVPSHHCGAPTGLRGVATDDHGVATEVRGVATDARGDATEPPWVPTVHCGDATYHRWEGKNIEIVLKTQIRLLQCNK